MVVQSQIIPPRKISNLRVFKLQRSFIQNRKGAKIVNNTDKNSPSLKKWADKTRAEIIEGIILRMIIFS